MDMDTEILPAAMFDYAVLDAETRIVVQQRTSEIRTIARRAATDVIEIGTKLLEVKGRLEHGKFGEWLSSEFGWSQDTAGRFMSVSARFGQIPQIAEFAPSALYLLAAPSVPEDARAAALRRAAEGERITVAKAQEIIAEQYATPDELVGPVRTVVLRLAQGEAQAAQGLLTQITAGSPAGNALLVRIKADPDLPQPCRLSDVRTACRAYLAELQTPARPPAQAVYTGVQPAAHSEPTGPGTGIRSQMEVDLAAAKLRWQVRAFLGTADPLADWTKLEKAARMTSSILDLEGFAASRGQNFDWEALVGAVGPIGSQDQEALRRAVAFEREVLLAQLAALPSQVGVGAEVLPDPEPADLVTVVIRWLDAKVEENAIPEGQEESRYVLRGILNSRNNGFALAWRELKTQANWPAGTQDGAKLDAVRAALAQLGGGEVAQPAPITPAYARPNVLPTLPQTLKEIERLTNKLHSQTVAIDKALGYLKSLAVAEEEAIDEDLIECIAALEAAR